MVIGLTRRLVLKDSVVNRTMVSLIILSKHL
nr:MAG TPA: hypothetical protein [Caudoviricetes sp.]